MKWSGPLKIDYDDVVRFPIASLPPVISPIRPLMTIPAAKDVVRFPEAAAEIHGQEEVQIDEEIDGQMAESDSDSDESYIESPP